MDGTLRARIETLFAGQVASLTGCTEFRALEEGAAPPERYDALIANVARTHLRSPQLLAFLYSLAPPAAAEDLRHNLLEELGLGEEGGRPHPDLLKDLVAGAGLSHRLAEIEAQAEDDIRRAVVEPLIYGTLGEVGLAALAEIVAFEYMLSHVSGRLAQALAEHRGLPAAALAWFTRHAQVDVRHAEQGLADLEAYVAYYDLGPDEALTIVEMALRDDAFARRYFRDLAAPAGGVR